jgi:beta-glucosidase
LCEGDGGTQNGVDEGNTICDEATLRKLFLPPYRAAIKVGVGSIMVSYSSWNGKKMHASKYLLTEVLKGEFSFQGFLMPIGRPLTRFPVIIETTSKFPSTPDWT